MARRDCEIIDLALSHRLSATDMAAVLGFRPTMCTLGFRALGVSWSAPSGCCSWPVKPKWTVRPLAEELRGWDGRLDPKLRKRLGRRIDGCANGAA